jgi:hypothetical protein
MSTQPHHLVANDRLAVDETPNPDAKQEAHRPITTAARHT